MTARLNSHRARARARARATGAVLAFALGAAGCASDGVADDVTAASVVDVETGSTSPGADGTGSGDAGAGDGGLDDGGASATDPDSAGVEADEASTGGGLDEQASGDGEAGESVGGVQPEGFGFVGARITEPDGEVCEVCLWLAETPEQRGRGLMGVTDLGPAAGMAFVFPGLITGAFYMFQTPTPLEIHWVGPGGDIVGAALMEPCLDQPAADCARYRPADAYTIAIETFVGGAAAIGLGPDSRVELIDPAAVCPTE